MEDAQRIRVGSETGRTDALSFVLETLSTHYTFDAQGRIRSRRDGGVPPRFVLGRTPEGCVWRFGADVCDEQVVRVARLAGRERGAGFEGELPAPPDRLGSIEALLGEPVEAPGEGAERAPGASRARRSLLTREGVTVGEIWRID